MDFTGQVTVLVMIMMTGIILGILFDCYRVLRRVFKPRGIITWFTDLLYWLLATAVVIVSLVLSNWGELRFYVFIGIVSGLGLYYKWLSQGFMHFFLQSIRVVVIGLRFLKDGFSKVILRPLVYCIKIISWPVWFLGHKGILWCRIRWTKAPNDEKK